MLPRSDPKALPSNGVHLVQVCFPSWTTNLWNGPPSLAPRNIIYEPSPLTERWHTDCKPENPTILLKKNFERIALQDELIF